MAQRCSAARFFAGGRTACVKGMNEKMISNSANPDYKYYFRFRMILQIKPPFLVHASAALNAVKVGLERVPFNRVPQPFRAPP